jgi:hypothetical protein
LLHSLLIPPFYPNKTVFWPEFLIALHAQGIGLDQLFISTIETIIGRVGLGIIII